MTENILVLDLETKTIFGDHSDRRPESLGVSVVGTYCYRSDTYRIYDEAEIGALEHRLSDKPLVVGFNIRRFDMPVLKPYLHFDPAALPMLDILEIIHGILGHRVSLESIAQATLGAGKSGTGLDAVEYYRTGAMDKLRQYCLDDVKVTRQIFEYGAEHHELFYLKKFDRSKARVPVAWEVAHPDATSAEAAQIGLFTV
ncbi:MAG: ribonuclease H-like domain-containing protein [Deltaproteobacteria bacterium]|nr:ribonuclease H-like domain-containing protein [Deltaproteobacteria bacterium]